MTKPDELPPVNGDPYEAISQLTSHEPERHDLVIGFVAARGTKWDSILPLLEEEIRNFRYDPKQVNLAALLRDVFDIADPRSEAKRSPGYYEKYMNAGDTLRKGFRNGSALAALAVRQIVSLRRQSADATSTDSGNNATGATECGEDTIRTPVVYLLKSLKHPEEVKLLRRVYGESFFLLGIASNETERRKVLNEDFSYLEDTAVEVERLIARDQADHNDREYGQNVRDTYAQSDGFIRIGEGRDSRREVHRLVHLLFGDPFITPNRAEEAMRLAQDAAARSAAIPRQVGAALVPAIGTPVVTGTNEVPKPGGGQYWEGDDPDLRDFQKKLDPNPGYRDQVIQELMERLAQHKWLADEYSGYDSAQLMEHLAAGEIGESILQGTRVTALIEFTRCLHAEQAAIANAARAGVATKGATLYCTTFPCHECAKMIVGAGIAAVYYVEPYPKSLVGQLYRGIIDTSPAETTSGDDEIHEVSFRQFAGIAPRRFGKMFSFRQREYDGKLIDFISKDAHPNVEGYSWIAIEAYESAVIKAVTRILEDSEFRELTESANQSLTVNNKIAKNRQPELAVPQRVDYSEGRLTS